MRFELIKPRLEEVLGKLSEGHIAYARGDIAWLRRVVEHLVEVTEAAHEVVDAAGIVFSDPRVPYYLLQVEKESWERLSAILR